MTCFHDAVYFELTLCEFSVHRESTSVVRAVVLGVFCTRVAQCEAAAFQYVVRRCAVHYLAMLCEDCSETYLLTHRVSHTVNLSANVLLGKSRFCETHCGGVHLVTNGACFLNFCNLNVGFHLTHLYHSHYQFHRCCFLLL